MALLKRFDTLEVATADLADAVKTYRENFGFELKPGPEAKVRRSWSAVRKFAWSRALRRPWRSLRLARGWRHSGWRLRTWRGRGGAESGGYRGSGAKDR